MSVKNFLKSLSISIFALFWVVPAAALAQTGGTVSVSPASQTIPTTGSSFTVEIRASNLSGVGAYGFDLKVSNPAVIRIDSATNGSFLGSTGRTVSALPATINNTTGVISFGAYTLGATPGGPNTGASPGSVLATVSMTALTNGSVSLSLQNTYITDINGNTLGTTLTGGTVTVGTSTPSVTITVPSRTPTPTTVVVKSPTPTMPSNTGGTTYLSDMSPSSTTNGWGPYERDMSNGGNLQGDGAIITINGQTFAKGLGTHANSELIYNLGGQYNRFQAQVGIDDEVDPTVCWIDNLGNQHCGGAAQFQVYGDGTLLYDSGVVDYTMAPKAIDVSVVGVSQLRLVTNQNGGEGNHSDHTDWGDAKVTGGAVVPSNTPVAPSLTPRIPSNTPAVPSNTPGGTCGAKPQGDANCNGLVNGQDYSYWLNSQCVPGAGQTCASYAADFNNDGKVNDTDLSIWQNSPIRQ